ncbi:uncharacterized protein B0J16DRAFT_315602 [Fusarium flagelliforme]|uniref:Uncharacterized protein n=1 Tax=Fusarium flagelliforme TaxID=2675880 RepID=A0A395N5R7_9HYPO|nr:uncharacterized protein B0J16DRAFT_315602 [Fusarium flagelliforme]KAH7191902.1 hypothetical protein B0J16DRAFT_315602 [Fusarium flagelliforme]RFN55123.1 hypothetical protein FIE12Z_635 [Fusarium flagelliforme]
MSSKRPRVGEGPDERPDEVNTIPSVESLLRKQHQELLDAFTRLEAHNKQVVAESEEKMNDLKRQNQELRSEIESLRTAPKPATNEVALLELAVSSWESSELARQFNRLANVTLRLNLTTGDRRPGRREVEGLCRIMYDNQRLSRLECFMQQYSSCNFINEYCIDQIGMGNNVVAASEGWGSTCLEHKGDDGCVWITKRGAAWIIGSGRPSC